MEQTMIADTDIPAPAGMAERAARMTRAELEGLFLGVVGGLLDDRDRRQVELAAERLASGQKPAPWRE